MDKLLKILLLIIIIIMFSNICNEIKKCALCRQTKIKPLSIKKIKQVQIHVPIHVPVKPPKINNKLISCYEEDYTRNITEIMKLWQRN